MPAASLNAWPATPRWCPGPDSNRQGLRRRILSPLCLPISPPGLVGQGASRNRTDVHGFAVRCITTLPSRHRKSAEGTNKKWEPSLRLNSRGSRGGRKAAISPGSCWSGKRVSNSRPQPWQGCALPTELFPLGRLAIIASTESLSRQPGNLGMRICDDPNSPALTVVDCQ